VDRLNYLRNLETRKQEVEKSITEQGKFTEEIALALEKAETLTEVEDIYRPFKKKKETRATKAIAKGLLPLAETIFEQDKNGAPLEELAKDYNVVLNYNNSEEAAKKIANLDAELKKAQTAAKSFGSGVTTGLQAVSSLAMGINSLSSAWDTINNPDLSTFEKITSVLMSMGFAIPGLISGFKGLGTAFLDIRASLGGSY
jgi:septation ring formation regulator EzrA